MQYPYYQPYPVYQPSPMQQGIAGVRFVSGEDEAKSVAIPYGSKALFMDANEDAFYVKETDMAGASTVEKYTFQKVEPVEEEYVTREEFDELRRAYESTLRQGAADARREPDGTIDAVHQNDQPRAGEGAGAAARQGAWGDPAGMGRDGGARHRDM